MMRVLQPKPGVVAAALTLALIELPACARSGPPAPIDDRTGAYHSADRSTEARSQPVSTTSVSGRVSGAGTPGAVTSSGLSAPEEGLLTVRQAETITVRRGETLYAISRRARVPLRALIDANSLDPPYHLKEGQTLRIPAVRVYVVARGDTAYGISRKFGVGVNALVRENELEPPDYALYAGTRLILPEPEERQEPAAALSQATRPSEAPPPPAAAQSQQAALPAVIGQPPARAGTTFFWPVEGEIVSGFGPKGSGLHNDGINIAVPEGTTVRAAENGVVAYAGNELRGYGNLLLIRHADNWVSAYAHNSDLLVNKGDVVKRGQPIARVGRTGGVATPQLHFELRRGRQAVDPISHLSRTS